MGTAPVTEARSCGRSGDTTLGVRAPKLTSAARTAGLDLGRDGSPG